MNQKQTTTVHSCTFQQAGGWDYRLHVHEPLADTVHVHIASRWAGAHDANAERTCLRLNLSRAELQTLIEGLQAAL